MYEYVKTGCKHIPPSEQPLQFQSGCYLNKPRIILYYNLMGPPSYVPCVIDQNVVVRRMTVYEFYTSLPWFCNVECVCVHRKTFYWKCQSTSEVYLIFSTEKCCLLSRRGWSGATVLPVSVSRSGCIFVQPESCDGCFRWMISTINIQSSFGNSGNL